MLAVPIILSAKAKLDLNSFIFLSKKPSDGTKISIRTFFIPSTIEPITSIISLKKSLMAFIPLEKIEPKPSKPFSKSEPMPPKPSVKLEMILPIPLSMELSSKLPESDRSLSSA